MHLFKEEVYQKLEEKLKAPSNYTGVEEALRMINADQRLQDFIRAYAVKNGIKHNGYGDYGLGIDCCGGPIRHLEIELWKGKGKHPNLLYIGPDAQKKPTPFFFRTYSTEADGLLVYENLLIEEKEDTFYINTNDSIKSQILAHTCLVPAIPAKKILSNLEKSLLKLLLN